MVNYSTFYVRYEQFQLFTSYYYYVRSEFIMAINYYTKHIFILKNISNSLRCDDIEVKTLNIISYIKC